MLKERLKSLFSSYDPAIRQIIYEVSELEQRYISMKKPRGIRNEIDEIVTRVAKQELESSRTSELSGQD
ncbi:MAG: hypothetical protein KDI79_09265 [Anaerolineae bacterium]|nr:hypothetical protein [Anaerolineae bacterium]